MLRPHPSVHHVPYLLCMYMYIDLYPLSCGANREDGLAKPARDADLCLEGAASYLTILFYKNVNVAGMS